MSLLFKARYDYEMMQLCLSTELAVEGVALICDNLGRPCVITAVSSSHRHHSVVVGYVLPAAGAPDSNYYIIISILMEER